MVGRQLVADDIPKAWDDRRFLDLYPIKHLFSLRARTQESHTNWDNDIAKLILKESSWVRDFTLPMKNFFSL